MAASRKATQAMKEYQLFILTFEGRVKAQYDLICADEMTPEGGLPSSTRPF
jgi:hypothetical protein